MSFLIKDYELLRKCNKIWDKVSEPVYNELYLNTEIKSYEGEINTNFYENGVPKEGSNQ